MSDKIFWGFDAFEEGLTTSIFVGEVLASLNEKLKADIHPVFTIGSEPVDLIPTFISETIGAMTKIAEEKMQSVLIRVKILNIRPPRVIVEHSFSKTRIVKNFISYAEKNGAMLIAVGSHGKKGIERAVLGSFAETLLLKCHLPVLVVGPNFDQIPKWNEVLFPTDFGDDSSYAFHKALELAKSLSARVTLFHHLSPLVDPHVLSAIAPLGGVLMSYGDEMNNLKQNRLRALGEWKKIATENGLETRTFLDTEFLDTSEAILSYANANKIGLITMGAQSGPLATTLFGSITRKVVRQAQSPVWLLRRR